MKKAVKVAVADPSRGTAARLRGGSGRTSSRPPSVAVVPPLASTQSSTDPRFSYCYEANDAGFGPYYQGQDAEYDWYDDRDGDGIVCEY